MTLFQVFKKVLYKSIIGPFNKLRFAAFGAGTIVYNSVKVDGPQRIFVGDEVIVSSYGWLAAVPHTHQEKCELIIGNGTYIGRFCHIYATSRIEIGKKVLIADKVYISDNLHGYENINIPIIDQLLVQTNEVTIGDGAWLGENVCVIGASVGRQCVIGANAVVTKDIPDYCIAVGIPAKIVKRYNFDTLSWQKANEKGEYIL